MSIEAEQSLLGCMMVLEFKGEKAGKVMTIVKPSFFEHPLNRSVYETGIHMANQGDAVDAITLDAKLTHHPVYKDLGSLSYLVDLVTQTPSAANIMAYVKIVRDRAIERFSIRKLNEALAEITDQEGGDISQRIGRAESILAEINKKATSDDKGLKHIKEYGKQWHDALEQYHSGDKDAMGLTTGITPLDAMLRPKLIPKGSLVVVGARPKMGKTALLSLIANHSGVGLRLHTPVFSMEMPGDQVFERSLTTDGKINPMDYYNASSGDVYNQLHDSTARLVNSLIYVDDAPGMTLSHIQREARQLGKKGQVGFICVDYLTLMKAEKAERNDLAYGEITKSLKNLAKELDCAVLLLTQLNRALESRTDKKPMPSDSRDTGQIEQDCDMWIGLYRHGVYEPDCRYPQLTEGIVRLNRHGKTGSFFLNLEHGYFNPMTELEGLAQREANEAKQPVSKNF